MIEHNEHSPGPAAAARGELVPTTEQPHRCELLDLGRRRRPNGTPGELTGAELEAMRARRDRFVLVALLTEAGQRLHEGLGWAVLTCLVVAAYLYGWSWPAVAGVAALAFLIGVGGPFAQDWRTWRRHRAEQRDLVSQDSGLAGEQLLDEWAVLVVEGPDGPARAKPWRTQTTRTGGGEFFILEHLVENEPLPLWAQQTISPDLVIVPELIGHALTGGWAVLHLPTGRELTGPVPGALTFEAAQEAVHRVAPLDWSSTDPGDYRLNSIDVAGWVAWQHALTTCPSTSLTDPEAC